MKKQVLLYSLSLIMLVSLFAFIGLPNVAAEENEPAGFADQLVDEELPADYAELDIALYPLDGLSIEDAEAESAAITANPPAMVEVSKDGVNVIRNYNNERLAYSGEQISFHSAENWGSTVYWQTFTYSSGDSRLSDYTAWKMWKIDGRTDLLYISAVGAAQTTNWQYSLTRYEPWIKSSGPVLVDFDPSTQIANYSENTQLEFSLSGSSGGIKVKFTPRDDTFNPYPNANHFSVEWRGFEWPNNAAGNEYVTRWEGYGSYSFANCGRGSVSWGVCTNR